MYSMSDKKPIIITINDIFDELMDENKRLIKCLNELNLHLIKIHSKYETIIDCEDKQHFNDWTQRWHQLVDKTSCDDNNRRTQQGCDVRSKSPSNDQQLRRRG